MAIPLTRRGSGYTIRLNSRAGSGKQMRPATANPKKNRSGNTWPAAATSAAPGAAFSSEQAPETGQE
jgi:hypothetical protein